MNTLFEVLPRSLTMPGYAYCKLMPLLSLELDAVH